MTAGCHQPSSVRMEPPTWAYVLWTLVFMQFRPAIVGESMNQAVFGLLVAVTFGILWMRGRLNPFLIEKPRAIGFLFVFATANYFLCQGFLISDAAERLIVNSVLAILGPALCFFLIQEPRGQDIILKTFIYAHFVLALSSIATLVLFACVGFDVQRILIGIIKSPSGDAGDFFLQHAILLPFSLIWSSLSLGGITFPRFLGIYREPGMSQIFFFTAYFLTFYVPLRKLKWIRAILLFGSIVTFSTSGFVSLAGGILCLNLFGRSRKFNPVAIIITASVIALLISAIIFMPEFGILAKAENFSGLDRLKSLAKSWSDFVDNPWFGQGYYSGFAKDKEGAVIGSSFYGILDVLRQIGITGITLYLATWWWGVFKLGNWKSLCIYIPCFLTLFTQPSYNDVFVWFLLLLDTRGFSADGHVKPVPGMPDSGIGKSLAGDGLELLPNGNAA